MSGANQCIHQLLNDNQLADSTVVRGHYRETCMILVKARLRVEPVREISTSGHAGEKLFLEGARADEKS